MTISRKERDDQRRREEILKSALSIFATQGFHGTTMAQISQESQYPLGTIYKYFSSKKQIYHDLVMERVHRLGQIFFEISTRKELSAREKLRECFFAKASFYRLNSDFIRIYISERSTIDAVVVPKLNEKVNRMHEKEIALFQKIFEQGGESEFKPYPAREMAMLFSEMTHAVAWAAIFGNDKESGENIESRDDNHIANSDIRDINNITNNTTRDHGTNKDDIDKAGSHEDALKNRLDMIFEMLMSGIATR
ncbi:Transcriptional regulator (TetR-family protein) (modular protein) [Desulfamplus magnetovallimortis]|uniref:Transcriptional regulator (TetR-family protein) (Modular protein) n=1 Tax=Desulfamplus magnetovallimortis TaxID=1246637 RepID=A0A1W1HBU9_9BACT|nr:TetR/AcrR family transcriptional regulator [Desulfamplus magnetovallimortis]SLM29923.1 Transcriptional regulator (TetR-family protein) (modular protein) [Desulfamplus magnetovallimortis]